MLIIITLFLENKQDKRMKFWKSVFSCIDRFIKNNPNATEQEIQKYKDKKSKMYEWYKAINCLIENIDKL